MGTPRPTWLIPAYKQCLQSCELGRTWRCNSAGQKVVMDRIAEQHDRLDRWGEGVGYNRWFETGVNRHLHLRLYDDDVHNRLENIFNSITTLVEWKLINLMFHYRPSSYDAESSAATKRQSSLGAFVAKKMGSARWALKDKPVFEEYATGLTSYVDELYGLISNFHLDSTSRPPSAVTPPVPPPAARGSLQQPRAEAAQSPISRTPSAKGPQACAVNYQAATPVKLDITSLKIEAQAVSSEQTGSSSLSDHSQPGIKGMVDVSLTGASHPVQASLTWKAVDDLNVTNHHREMEYAKPEHPSWDLMYSTVENGNLPVTEAGTLQRDYSLQEPEGRIPGTRTAQGFAAYQTDWAPEYFPELDQRMFRSSGRALPRHAAAQLVEWMTQLQNGSSLPTNMSNEHAYDYIHQLLGDCCSDGTIPASYDSDAQIGDLLMTLNRRDILPEYDQQAAPVVYFISQKSDRKMMLVQLIAAYVLKLLLEQRPSTVFLNLGDNAVAAMEVAQRWFEGVKLTTTAPADKAAGEFNLQSRIQARQVEGLLRFAERLRWPLIDETRGFLQSQQPSQVRPGMGSLFLLNWLCGTLVPGNGYVTAVMSALAAATPSFAIHGGPEYLLGGLVVKGCSYWRSRDMLGRVLGGSRGVQEVGGWIGPCPVPHDRAGPLSDGWYSAAQIDTTFIRVDRVPGPVGAGLSGLQSHVAAASSGIEPIRTATGYVRAWPPAISSTNVQLKAVRFVSQHLNPPMMPGDERDNVIVELEINNEQVVFKPNYHPAFVAAPRCIDGPHMIDATELVNLQHVIDVADLPGHTHTTDSRVLIINATGQGDCDLAARAWCCEKNRHAVVARSAGGTCIVCAVRMASDRGLGIGCLIWTAED